MARLHFILCFLLIALYPEIPHGTSCRRQEKRENACNVKMHTFYTITSQNDGDLASDQPPKTFFDIRTSAKVVHAIPSDGDFERWSFQKVGSGGIVAYSIINKRNNLALTVEGESLDEGAHLVLSPFTDSAAQKFILTPASDGQCLISALHSGKFVTNDGPPRMTGMPSPVTQNIHNGNKVWEISPLPCDPYPGQPYRLIHRLSDLVAGIRGGSKTPSERVRLLQANETSDYTKIQFTPLSNQSHLYNIHFRHSGQRMSVNQGKTKKSTPVTQSNPSEAVPHEQFSVESTWDGWCLIAPLHSRRYLAAEWETGNTYPVGVKLIQLYQTPSPEEHFRLEHSGFIPEPQLPYRVRNRRTGKYMEVNLGSTADMAPIAESKYSEESQHQVWDFKLVENLVNVYHIQAKHSRMLLTADTANDGTPIVQRPPEPGDKQHFMLVEGTSQQDQSNSFRIVSVPTQKVLMPIAGNPGDCVGVSLATRDDNDTAQEWEILRDMH